MGSTASALSARLYTLILLFFLTAAVCVNAQSEGMQASVENYILPQYREKDNRLDYVIYGDRAENRGALLHLEKVKIDILNTGDKGVYNLKDAEIYRTATKGEKIPDAYDIASTVKSRREFAARLLKNDLRGNISRNIQAERKLLQTRNQFWRNNKKQKNVNAWVYADAASYDKNARILRSDNDVAAHFRTRDIDADGIGFDAYNQKENKRIKNASVKKRFIHIRSNVRIVNYDFKDDPAKDKVNFIAVADNMDIDNGNKDRVIFTLRKNVKIEQIEDEGAEMAIRVPGSKSIKVKTVTVTQITCDKMVINSNLSQKKEKVDKKKDETERLEKIEFFENVVITRVQVPVDAKYAAYAKKEVITCKYATFNMQKQKVTLQGNPVLTSGRDRITGQKLEIYLRKVEEYDKKKKKKAVKLEPVKVSMKLPVITYYGDNQPGKAAAAPAKNQIPYHVESDTMDYDIDKQICTLHGNVICEQKKIEQDAKHKVKLENHTRISCNKMVIALEDKPKQPGKSKDKDSGGKQLKQIECFDDVVITRKVEPLVQDVRFKELAKDEASESDYAKFDNKKQILSLSGRPIITSDKNLLQGKKIEVFFKKSAADANKEKLEPENVKIYMPDLTYFGDTQLSENQRKSKKDTANKPPSYVSAMLMDYDVKKDICTLQYEVRVRQTTFDEMQISESKKKPVKVKTKVETELQCEKLCLHLKDAPKNRKDKDGAKKELKKLECFRDVYITRKNVPLDPKYIHYAEIQSSRSDYAEYDLHAQKLMLSEKPVLRSGFNRLNGERMEIQLEKSQNKAKSVAQNMDFNIKDVKVYMPVLHYYENALSQTEKNKKLQAPVLAESNILHYDPKTDLCTLLGNVRVDDKANGKITCDKMLIYLENAPQTAKTPKAEQEKQRKQLKKLECFGEVRITHLASAKDKGAKDRTSISDYAVYDPKKLVMTLTGNPVLKSGRDKQSGERIDIFFAEDEESALHAGSKDNKPKLMIKNVKVSMPVINYRGDTQLPGGRR